MGDICINKNDIWVLNQLLFEFSIITFKHNLNSFPACQRNQRFREFSRKTKPSGTASNSFAARTPASRTSDPKLLASSKNLSAISQRWTPKYSKRIPCKTKSCIILPPITKPCWRNRSSSSPKISISLRKSKSKISSSTRTLRKSQRSTRAKSRNSKRRWSWTLRKSRTCQVRTSSTDCWKTTGSDRQCTREAVPCNLWRSRASSRMWAWQSRRKRKRSQRPRRGVRS